MSKSKNQDSGNFQAQRFPCQQCGALLTFKPGTQRLGCDYCGKENLIDDRLETIREYDLQSALSELLQAKPVVAASQILCDSCGANFKFADSVHAGECPFCGSGIITEDAKARPVTPKSLLPFKLEEQEAKKRFRAWLQGLWFAPNQIKKYTDEDAKLKGIYIPFWTFDSDTQTLYQGARGTFYYVEEKAQSMQGGRLINQTRQVQQVRWQPAHGMVKRFFDDVLVGASRSLPRQILDRLEPWDLENLTPYNESYLSGFSSEIYQVDLDQGFDEAKRKMDNVIYHDIALDIGGDQQRIDRFHTQHNQTTFKHCLLPVWSAAFRYRDKTYRFIINARTGLVQGERPYSKWKIGVAIVAGLTVAMGLAYLAEHMEIIRQMHNPR